MIDYEKIIKVKLITKKSLLGHHFSIINNNNFIIITPQGFCEMPYDPSLHGFTVVRRSRKCKSKQKKTIIELIKEKRIALRKEK